VVEDVRVVEVKARQRANAVRAEELRFVQHARQDAPQFLLVTIDSMRRSATPAARAVHVGGELGVALPELPARSANFGSLARMSHSKTRDRGQRQQTDDRAHLERVRRRPGKRSTS
jgi:hypothetical protein